MFYEEALRKLVDAGSRFLIVGGVAVNLHGVPRMTADLDLLIDLDPGNVERTVAALLALGYRPRAPVDPLKLAIASERETWVREKGMKAFSFFHPGQPFQVVDIRVEAPVDDASCSPRSVSVMAEGLKLGVVSIADLIRMKEHAGRAQDLADIRSLRRLEDEDKP